MPLPIFDKCSAESKHQALRSARSYGKNLITTNLWSDVKWITQDSLMADCCYNSSDKHASIGYCSHLRFLLFFSFLVICQKWKIQNTFFPLNGCPLLELLIWRECGLSGIRIRIPKFWHPASDVFVYPPWFHIIRECYKLGRLWVSF